MSARLELIALNTIPLVSPGDPLARLINHALVAEKVTLEDGDVVVVAQKIVSKSEGRYAYLREVEPSLGALELAEEVDKDPRLVQLILDESKELVRFRKGAVIVEHKLGFVHAHAGIDQSNIASDNDNPRVLLLPEMPDISASELKVELKHLSGADVTIIINDSAGRAWRNGTVGFAIGTAGFDPLVDMTGHKDLFDRELQVTQVAVADELAAAASFLMGQADEGAPVVVIKGANLSRQTTGSNKLIRHKSEDLFR